MAERRSGRPGSLRREHLHPSLWSQTMNIVGQLAETVFVTVKELYRGLNPATLTGGIDVIVVRQPDGSFQCSPFHVRFGKLGVLRSKEKIVDIKINGEAVDLHMKLGDNGEAFFVEENENMQVPAYLCTSPIPQEAPEEIDVATEEPGARRKKRRRRRVRSDSHLREEVSSSSEERDREESEREADAASKELSAALLASKSVYYSLSEEPKEELGAAQNKDTHPHSDGEQSPSENVFFSRPDSPKSDSELLVRTQDLSGLQMQWNWGGFPMPCHPEKAPAELQAPSPSSTSHFRTIERQDSFDLGYGTVTSCHRAGGVTVVKPHPRTLSLDLGNSSTQSSPLSLEKNSLEALSSHSDLFMSCVSSGGMDSTQSLERTPDGNDRESPSEPVDIYFNTSQESTEQVSSEVEMGIENRALNKFNRFETQMDDSTVLETRDLVDQQHQAVLSEQREPGSSHSAPVGVGDGGIFPGTDGGDEDNVARANDGSPASSMTAVSQDVVSGINAAKPSEASSTAEQDKRKGKRNHHLGPSDIYLDDLTTLDPEVAALYFPKTEAEAAFSQNAEQSSCSGSQSPQSVGSGAMDSGTEYLSDSASYSMDVSLSLCGQEGGTNQITKEKFTQHLVTYQDLVNNPGIIEDQSLVVCINSNYYNWAVAAPMILSMTAFQKHLPKSTIEQLVKDKMPKKSGRWWFSWRRRDMDNKQKQSKEEQEEPLASVSSTVQATLDDVDSDEAAGLGRKATIPSDLSTETMNMAQSISQMYRKSLRLTSKQIENLNLHEGANKVVFSVTTQYQGTCRCEAAIYLWNWDDRVIISDIDGTITKSDALGHILPQFGKDWTHKGIAKLYHKIHQNGYKFLYCSARAIGMAAITKDYLQWVNDQGTVLPKGPVLLAPSSLFSALHREVIEKKPEVFKIACLSDIGDLFRPHKQPFYAAFGNRTNDAYAYKQVGVSEARIFTVNPKGELIQEMTKGNKSSYNHLSGLVEHFFPVLSAEGSNSSVLDYPDYSSFSYWKEPLPKLDMDALL
ncbi:phosphatidate phosphatase LPIN2-like isoform X2 [Cyprinodon tularosa]|uniref:phosphatidate phosphatase LPIN2-like isoform X2 n=1 Tax=Cyprinodon tularosa TaxID=77115 RepID=UPI0018E2187F|nr:phosphatidate phosphatase LPIN2-like isoform X2 [Cyprinodon tularosa]